MFDIPQSLLEAAQQVLTEGKIDVLKSQNPDIAPEIDHYANQDNTPTKKFLPWLVSQHKKGNVTIHNDVSGTLDAFESYKNMHGIKDHTQYTYPNLRARVMPYVGGPKTRKEEVESIKNKGVEQVHSSGNVSAYHIKTKEASQALYGGGEGVGKHGTSWCVSARSDSCLFGDTYGKMYTIHAENDHQSPYAVHPDNGTVTTKQNDGDNDIKQIIGEKPHIKDAVDAIVNHHYDSMDNIGKAKYLIGDKYHPTESIRPEHFDALVHGGNEQDIMDAVDHPQSTIDKVSLLNHTEDNQMHMVSRHILHRMTTEERGRSIDIGMKVHDVIPYGDIPKQHIDRVINKPRESYDDGLEVAAVARHAPLTKEQSLKVSINHPDKTNELINNYSANVGQERMHVISSTAIRNHKYGDYMSKRVNSDILYGIYRRKQNHDVRDDTHEMVKTYLKNHTNIYIP